MSDDFKRFELIQDDMHHESVLFLTRFTGFTTLHAGLFVIATSTGVQAQPVASVLITAFGLLLSVVWIGIHYLSRLYIERLKPLYREERERALKLETPHPANGPESQMQSTQLSAAVPFVVLGIWLVLVVISLQFYGHFR